MILSHLFILRSLIHLFLCSSHRSFFLLSIGLLSVSSTPLSNFDWRPEKNEDDFFPQSWSTKCFLVLNTELNRLLDHIDHIETRNKSNLSVNFINQKRKKLSIETKITRVMIITLVLFWTIKCLEKLIKGKNSYVCLILDQIQCWTKKDRNNLWNILRLRG